MSCRCRSEKRKKIKAQDVGLLCCFYWRKVCSEGGKFWLVQNSPLYIRSFKVKITWQLKRDRHRERAKRRDRQRERERKKGRGEMYRQTEKEKERERERERKRERQCEMEAMAPESFLAQLKLPLCTADGILTKHYLAMTVILFHIK